jgi:hypothetical protein
MSLTIPQGSLLSGYWEITPTIASGNFDWQNWSQFGEPEVLGEHDEPDHRPELQDTFGVAAGRSAMDPLLRRSASRSTRPP